MDSNEQNHRQNKVIAFDTLFSTNHIQMLKVILPYMDNQTQKSMAVYIKFLELSYTIEFYKKHPYPVCGCMQKEAAPDMYEMCSELLPYCTESEKKQLEQLRNMFNTMEMYKEMSQTMDMMKDVFPEMGNLFSTSSEENTSGGEASSSGDASSKKENASGSPFGNMDIMGMLMNMLTPEQKEMFDLFGGNDHAE